MNTRIINIISSVVMFFAFFMPWISAFGFGGSPFQMIMQIFKNFKFISKEPNILLALVFLIFPICSAIVAYRYSQREIRTGHLSSLFFAKKAPLVIVILFTAYGFYLAGKIDLNVLESFVELISIGFVLTIIASIILAVNPTTIEHFSELSLDRDRPSKEEKDIGPENGDLFN